MEQARVSQKTYTVSSAASLWKVSKRILPDAMPSATVEGTTTPGQPMPSVLSFGWISGACSSPSKDDRYVVEFIGKREFRILGYIDRFGRAFATDEALVAPPARTPDLCFARLPDQSVSGNQEGCVEVCDSEGAVREVARYKRVRDCYTLFDSWFNFGPHGADLSYDDALARAYLAFVYRTAQGGAEVPARGLGFVHDCIREDLLLPGLRALVAKVQSAEADPVVQPPALVRCLAHWLVDAGLADLKVPDDAFRLVRTARYANIYYISQEDEEARVERPLIWALEGALNRFLLIEQAFGDRASTALEVDCARWDAYLIETAGAQELSFERSPGTPQGTTGGEWETRCSLSVALERLRLPLRVEMRQQMSVNEGVAALELTVPSGSLMPAWRWSDVQGAIGWHAVGAIEQEAQAARYAMHLGLALAAALFAAAPTMQKIEVLARPLTNAKRSTSDNAAAEGGLKGEFPPETPAYYYVTFTRQSFELSDGFRSAREGDPLSFFESIGSLFTVLGADVFAAVRALPEAAKRKELPELANAQLTEAAQVALGVREASGLRISADAQRRAMGERLADCIAQVESAIEAVRAVRAEQEAAELRDDTLASAACTRLMAALARGSLDTEDQNAVVSCFLGEDRGLAALARISALAEGSLDEAVKLVTDALSDGVALDGFADSSAIVYRSFDSYATRVLYERARQQSEEASAAKASTLASAPVPTLALRAAADKGKQVQLVPTSFYLGHLEVVNLLERSFERVEEALYFGRRAIELAPATAGGYRMLARAYMLVGDMDSAIAVLDSCLRVAVQPADIAIAYYQLAYVLWKAGRPREGAACYLKSIMTSSTMAMQSLAELKELIADQGIDPLERDEVDDVLAAAEIVLAPTSEVLDALEIAAAAATDANIFSVAHSVLSLRLRYRPDDALVNVLRSLDASLA